MTAYNPFDNQEFRKELGEMLDEKLRNLVQKVDEHEATIQRMRGAKWAAITLWTLIVGAGEYMFHRH